MENPLLLVENSEEERARGRRTAAWPAGSRWLAGTGRRAAGCTAAGAGPLSAGARLAGQLLQLRPALVPVSRGSASLASTACARMR